MERPGLFDAPFLYAVTARHVIDGITENKLGDFKVYLQMNAGSAETDPLAFSAADWYFHPSDDTVDVAVMPISFDGLDHRAGPVEYFVTDEAIERERIGLGENIFVVGQFIDRKENRVVPMIRAGNVSVMPETLIRTKWRDSDIEAYLVETRSMRGFSGSPVFVYLPTLLEQSGEYPQSPQQIFYLLGLLHGHWNLSVYPPDGRIKYTEQQMEGISAGIGIVVPAKKILEVLNQPRLSNLRREMEAEMKGKMALEYPAATPDAS